MKCAECLPRIEEYVDGELDGRTMERVAAHLSICAECQSEFAELQRDAEIYANYRRDIEVTPAQWNVVRARIEQEKDASLQKPATRRASRLGEAFGSSRRFRPAFAAALLLIVVGITAGVIYLNSRHRQANLTALPTKPNETLPIGGTTAALPPGKNQESTDEDRNREANDSNQQTPVVARNRTGTAGQKNNASMTVSPRRARNPLQIIALQPGGKRRGRTGAGVNVEVQGAPDRPFNFTLDRADAAYASSANFTALPRSLDFNSEIARHTERAEMLLRSFRNVRPSPNARALDVSYEKEQSRKLLYQNISLRRDAAARGDEPTAALLNQLEPILLDIANLPNRAKSRDVRSIEQRMEKKEIVATLQVRTLVAAN